MDFNEINELLQKVSKKRVELKDESISDLKILLDDLKDAQDFIFEISDRLERNISKLEEVIDDLEMEEDVDYFATDIEDEFDDDDDFDDEDDDDDY